MDYGDEAKNTIMNFLGSTPSRGPYLGGTDSGCENRRISTQKYRLDSISDLKLGPDETFGLAVLPEQMYTEFFFF